MSDSKLIIEQAKVVQAQALGFLAKLYYYKSTLLNNLDEMNSNTKHILFFLKDPELTKLRAKIEKKFPALPDLTKINGYETYINQNQLIVNELTSHYQLFVEIYDFVSKIRHLLQDFRSKIHELKLKKNRTLLLLWSDLIVSYVRIYYLLSLIPEKSTILALYCASAYYKEPSKPVRYVNELKLIIDESDNVLKHFFDTFSTEQTMIIEICYELKDTLQFASNSEIIRNMNLFNPIYESNQVMTQPAYKALSPVNDTSAYQEMLTLQQYYDFIIVSFLVCPPLLFQEKNYPLLQHIADYRYSMVIYRDLSINVHYEFEKIQTFYEASPSSFVVTIAKGFKLKSQLKQLSRTSITNVALKQRSRRLILRNDLQNLNKLIVLTPGIIAPKLPMLFSAASMLKNEIIAFFQHYPSASNIPYLRKDTKAYYKKEDYLYYDDIGHCLLELTNSIENIAVNYKAIIKPYYLEYVIQYDLPILKQLITPFQQYFPSLSSYYQNIVDTLTTFTNNPDVHIGLLNDVRQEYELLIFLLSSSNMNTVIKSSGKFYETFIKYTTQFIEHSYYYDSIERFIKEFIDPYPIYWYREQYIEIFKSTLTMTTLSTANKEKINKGKSTTNNEISDITMTPNTIIAFFLPLESVLNNIEKDCIEELPSIGLSAVKLSHRFMTILSEQLMNTLKQLWDFYQRLESQYHPIEAVKRIERALDAKLKNPNATTANNTLIDEEVLPGTESEEYAEKQIYKFIYLQKYLIYLMKPFINKKKLIIFNYEYSLISFLKEQLMNFFKNRFNQIFIINDVQSNNDNSTNTDAPVPGRGRSGSLTQQQQISGQVVLHRFSSSFYKFIYGLRVMQYSFQLLDININNTILSLLSLQCHDYQKIPTIGLFYEINLTTPTALYLKPPALPPSNTIGTLTGVGTTLIQQLGRWFLSIVYAINNRNFTNTLIWVPSKNTFINVNKQKVSYGRQGGDRFENMNPFAHNFAIELFLNHEDLIYLLQIIGLNGYQYIESLLVHLVTEQLILILRIIKAEYNNIQVLQRDYCLSVNVLFNMLKPLQELFYALRMIGTALIVRQMLLDALVVVTQKTVNDLYDSLHILHNSINHWHDAPPVSSTANASNGSTKIENPAAAPANTTNTSSSSSSSEILSTFYALCHSMGIVDERDYPLTLILIKTLEQSIKSMNDLTDKDIQLLQYLPILSSGLVIISEMNEIKSNNTSTSSSNHSYPIDFHQISNDFPNNLNYHQYYQIYSNNCHIIPYTLNKLFLFVFNFFQLKKYSFDEKIIQIQSIYDDVSYLTLHHNNNGNDSNGNNGHKKSKGNNIPLEINSLQSCYLSYISKNYLHITSQILLLLSSQAIHHINTLNASSSSLFGGGGGGSITATAGNNSGSGGINGSNNIGLIQLNYSNISFNSLYALLKLFIEFSPSFLKNNPAGLLEDVFPYDIIHNGLYEIALGKYNFHDRITSFIAK